MKLPRKSGHIDNVDAWLVQGIVGIICHIAVINISYAISGLPAFCHVQ